MGRRLFAKDWGVIGHDDAYVDIPDEWLGRHALKRDEAIRFTIPFNNMELTNLVIALLMVEDKGNIPGIAGNDPSKWDITETPLSLIAWLTDAVITDFNQSLHVRKNSSSPSRIGLKDLATETIN